MPKQQPPKNELTARGPEGKKPYRIPRLVEYGDLQKITMGKAGMMNDTGQGQPSTRK